MRRCQSAPRVGRARTVQCHANGFFDRLPQIAFPNPFGGPKAPKTPGRGQSRKLGTLTVSDIGMGTWAWGNQFLWGYDPKMDGELQATFDLAVTNGVCLFDTGDSYGTGKLDGRAELLLGKFMAEAPLSDAQRSNLHVGTKLAGYPWRIFGRSYVDAARASAKRMRYDVERGEPIALGQLHWATSNYQPLQEQAQWDGLALMYEEGVVANVGVSNYGPKQLRKIHAYLAARGVPLASAQIQLSLLSYGSVQRELLETCAELDVAVISYSPLALGLLTGQYREGRLPSGPRGQLFKSLVPTIAPITAVLQAVAEERGKSMSQVAINWAISKDTIPIPGAKNVAQCRDNLGAVGWRLSEGEVAELEAAVQRVGRGKGGGGAIVVQNIFQTR